MNWLEIAQRIRQECGIPGSGPTALTYQTGELKRIVDWMASAYNDIQAAHNTWKFLRKEFSFTCVAGTADYGAAQHSVSDLNEWDLDTFRCYLTEADEQVIDFYHWEGFRDTWKIGTARTRAGRPIAFSVKPNNSITFDCVPDNTYTIAGEYYRLPVAVGDTTDSPVFPEQYHMAIVYRALMMYAAYSAEPDKYLFGQDEFGKLLRRMESTQLPPMEEGPPLA